MLLIVASLASASPIAVDVSGMPPQLARVSAVAEAQRWEVICHGHQGEEGVLRLKLPPGINQDDVMTALGGRDPFVSSSTFFFADQPLARRCDHDPVRVSGDRASSALAFGPDDTLEKLLGLARSCGFAAAKVRDFRTSDLPVLPVKIKPEWKTLDAGEDLATRYGPAICFVQLRRSATETRIVK